MWEARNRRKSERSLEKRLRSGRPQADEALVRNIMGSVEPRRQPRAWSRLAFAAAFTTIVVGSFASFGAISYAATGATSAVHTLKKIAATKTIIVDRSAASDQYTPPNPGNEGQGNEGASNSGGVEGTAAVKASGTLPFTGISLLVTMVLGLMMLTTGLALRRRERRNN